jgi:Chaperone of endosialidase
MAYNFNQLNVKEKIGVGTETPSEALEVKGNIKLNSGVAVSEFSNDGTLAIVNDRSVPTTQSVKTYVDKQISTTNAVFANKAEKNGSSTQDFQANNLKVKGSLEVTGITTFRNIEQHEGDIELGNEDSDRVRIHGTVQSTNSSGTLQFDSPLSVNGQIGAGNSDLYFTKTDHNHTGFGNTSGFAAIENSADYGALMIIGRAGTPKGRCVKLWDFLEVNGEASIPAGNLSFGATTRQMIDLWTKEYGIGVQSGTTYFRSNNNFAWFRGGVHDDNFNNPGVDGLKLMSLNAAGDLCLSARTNPTGNPGLSPCRALADLGNTLMLNVGGDYSNGVEIFNGRFTSSREYKENIADLSTQEATIALKDLNPVKFSYKTDQSENLHVGFIAEDVPDLLAAHDKRSIGPLDVVAVLTKVVQEQQSTIASLIDRLNVLEAKQA